MKKLIVIDGVDSSGKETNTKYIYDLLKENEVNVEKISFPDYESDSSSLVKMYLNGDFGKTAQDVNPYTASSFYAVDRFASYKTKWGIDYAESNGIVIADRYVTSNMIHQASKISDETEKENFLKWLSDFEYVKLGLPVPDLVIFLNMPTWAAIKLMENRNNKITGDNKKDIHEKDEKYLQKSYENAISIAKKLSWNIIDCVENERIKTLEEIQKELKELLVSKKII